MKSLLVLHDDIICVATDILANELERQHRSVYLLVEAYEKELKMLGVLSFQMIKPKTKKGGAPKKVYYLNEEQYVFLITNMRTKPDEMDKVMKVKLQLSKQFVAMRKTLLMTKVNQQNAEWLETRSQGKKSRQEVTEAYARYLELAIKQNPETSYVKRPDNIYSNFTRMTYKQLFDTSMPSKKLRDYMTIDQLSVLGVAELALQRFIHNEIDEDTPFKEIYKKSQKEMSKFADIVGKSTILDLVTASKDIKQLT